KSVSQEIQRAKNTQRDLINAIHYLPKRMNGRHPQVLLTDALANTGITELTDHIEELFSLEANSGTRNAKRSEQNLYWLRKSREAGLLERFRENPTAIAAMEHAKAVYNGADPFAVAEEVIGDREDQNMRRTSSSVPPAWHRDLACASILPRSQRSYGSIRFRNSRSRSARSSS
ncbi:MAG: hypothetical protein IPI91_13950, partial [Flavobacteriales bacterium]|nr:hypothetical protein [Flavobacteriales bacterium]